MRYVILLTAALIAGVLIPSGLQAQNINAKPIMQDTCILGKVLPDTLHSPATEFPDCLYAMEIPCDTEKANRPHAMLLPPATNGPNSPRAMLLPPATGNIKGVFIDQAKSDTTKILGYINVNSK